MDALRGALQLLPTRSPVLTVFAIQCESLRVPKSNEFVQYLLELLSGMGPVRARAMFGGYGLYWEDLMFGLVADDVVYFKVDEVNLPDFDASGSQPFQLESKRATMSYYTVPDAALDDSELMCEWGQRGLEAARRASAKKKKRR